MNIKSRKQEKKNGDLYLKFLVIEVNHKIFRTYRLNYNSKKTCGILDTIQEYIADEKEEKASYTLRKAPEPESIFHEFESEYEGSPDHFFGMSIPQGKIDMYGYYSSRPEKDESNLPADQKPGFPKKDAAFYLIDFTGVGESEMAGYYLYNWKQDSARLVLEDIVPSFLTTMMVILLHYHKSLFYLITEINMFQEIYTEHSPVVTQTPKVKRAC